MRLIRRLVAGDVPALLDHMLGLSQTDRRLRFCAAAPDPVIRRYCASIDWGRSLLLGCFAGRRLVGALHLLMTDGAQPEVMEMALSVDRDQQGRGIGTELLARAAIAARSRGVRVLRFVCLAESDAMQRLALKMGGRLVTDGEQVDGTIDVGAWDTRPSSALAMARTEPRQAQAG